MVPDPVAEAFRERIAPAQMGLLLPALVMVGAAIRVPAQPQLGAVPV